jgi:hypothetical protein
MFVNEFGNDIKREYVNEFMIVKLCIECRKETYLSWPTFFNMTLPDSRSEEYVSLDVNLKGDSKIIGHPRIPKAIASLYTSVAFIKAFV